jgi:hypothetical protein
MATDGIEAVRGSGSEHGNGLRRFHQSTLEAGLSSSAVFAQTSMVSYMCSVLARQMGAEEFLWYLVTCRRSKRLVNRHGEYWGTASGALGVQMSQHIYAGKLEARRLHTCGS